MISLPATPEKPELAPPTLALLPTAAWNKLIWLAKRIMMRRGWRRIIPPNVMTRTAWTPPKNTVSVVTTPALRLTARAMIGPKPMLTAAEAVDHHRHQTPTPA